MPRKTHTTEIVAERHVDDDGMVHVNNVFKRSDAETARLQRIVEQLSKSRKSHRKREDEDETNSQR